MRFAPAFPVRALLLGMLAWAAASPARAAPSLQPDAATTAELESLRTQLLDALQAGDRAALERLLADGFVFVHSTGVMERREAFIARTVAMAGKSPPSRTEFLDDDVRRYGDTIVWVTRSRRVAPAPVGELNFRGTDVLVRREDRWAWASVQSTRLPTRPAAVALDATAVAAIVGRWEIAPGREVVVTGEASRLVATATGVRPVELVPTAPGEFAWFDPESNLDVRASLVGEPPALVLKREGAEAWRARKLVEPAGQ